MDEISLLRRSRNDIPERAPAAITRGRAALFGQIDGETPVALFSQLGDDTAFAPLPSRRRRRTAAWAGFSALGATALVGALVATNVLGGPGWQGTAEPAAAAALESAAVAALQVSDPVVSPGQYLLVRTDAVYGATGTLEEDADRIRRENNGNVQPEDLVSFLEKMRDEVFVPADREDLWVWVRCMRTPVETFGPRSEALAAQQMRESAEVGAADILQHLPGGIFPGGSAYGSYNGGNGSSGDYDALPRDPRLLLERIYQLNGSSGQSRDGQVLVWIADTLRSGIVPADLRAAIYQAAALIPGVTITEQEATLNGTTGIAIGRLETASNRRQDIIIDPATGGFIGERYVQLDGAGGFPPGTVTGWTAVTTVVVDSPPTDTSTCSDAAPGSDGR
ncbi:CU044_5270 family protein [Microbacterium sp. P07]|uniref:CU044_5270 family protein n=1 Tax=Microbacterium sp. P07 TaxID=3366952 RepID=UPI003746B4A2